MWHSQVPLPNAPVTPSRMPIRMSALRGSGAYECVPPFCTTSRCCCACCGAYCCSPPSPAGGIGRGTSVRSGRSARRWSIAYSGRHSSSSGLRWPGSGRGGRRGSCPSLPFSWKPAGQPAKPARGASCERSCAQRAARIRGSSLRARGVRRCLPLLRSSACLVRTSTHVAARSSPVLLCVWAYHHGAHTPSYGLGPAGQLSICGAAACAAGQRGGFGSRLHHGRQQLKSPLGPGPCRASACRWQARQFVAARIPL